MPNSIDLGLVIGDTGPTGPTGPTGDTGPIGPTGPIGTVEVMTSEKIGGAKLGKGLSLDSDALNLGPLTDSGSGASVETDGCGIFGVTGEGWSEQDTTTGKNLFNRNSLTDNQTVSITQLSNGFRITAVNSGGYSGEAITIIDDLTNYVGSSFTLSGSLTTTQRAIIALQCKKNDSEVKWLPTSNSQFSVTLNVTSDLAGANLRVYIYANGAGGSPGDYSEYYNVQLELGSTATSYEPYTGGKASPSPDYPQEIRVARGRNLLTSREAVSVIANPASSEEWFDQNGDLAHNVSQLITVPLEIGKTYCIHATLENVVSAQLVAVSGGDIVLVKTLSTSNVQDTFVAVYDNVAFRVNISGNTTATVKNPQLELGTQATPYVPYGHIGLDITANGQTTTTPIPLPSKGFAGALPDGTKDTLAIDSAGRVEWVNACGIVTPKDFRLGKAESGRALFVTQNVSSHGWGTSDVPPILATHMVAVSYSASWSPGTASVYTTTGGIVVSVDPTINTQALFASTYPTLEVLYPLATQTTESTYIQLPELPAGATVSIPELEAIGVEWWVDGIPEVTEYGQAMQARLQGEIDEAEQAIADNAAAIATLGESVSQTSYIRDHLPAARCTITRGGYFVVGNIVFVNITFTISDTNARIVGFPKPKETFGFAGYDGTNEKAAFAYMVQDTSSDTGALTVPGAYGSNGSLNFSFTYLKA